MLLVPTYSADKDEWLRQIALAINLLIDGKSNAIGEVTLTASAASTTVNTGAALRVGADSRILLMPTTANAAAALATTYIGTVGKQTFTVSHANNAQADKTFKYAIIG